MVTDEHGRVLRGGWWTKRAREEHSKDSGENSQMFQMTSRLLGPSFFCSSFSLLEGRVMVAAATYVHGM